MTSLAADSDRRQQEARSTALTAEGLLYRRATNYPEALALADPPNREVLGLGPGRSFLYREASAAVDALASFFIQLGLEPGDRIAIQLPNMVEQPLTILAAWRAGLTVCMLPMLWRRREIAKVLVELKPRALIGAGPAGEYLTQSLSEIAPAELSVRFVLGFGPDLPDGVAAIDPLLQAAPRDAATRPEPRMPVGPALISFTARAGIPLLPVFHAENEILAQGAMTVLALSLNRRDVILNPFPLAGVAGLSLALTPWLISGGALLQHLPFDIAGFARQLLDGEATVTALPPSMLAALQQDGVLRNPRCKLRRLGCVWSMAQLTEAAHARMPEVDHDAAQLFDLYPLGDLASLVRLRSLAANPALLPRGKIEVKGVDGDGVVLLETSLGESCGTSPGRELKLRGPIVPHGSAGGVLAPDPEGFVASGVCALWAERAEDLLKLCRDPELLHHGGVAIAANELDQLYQSWSAFLDAACFALPDPIVGDRVIAAVVPKPGRMFSLDALHRFLQHQGVAPYKYPDGLAVVQAIPRDADGRVLRDQLVVDRVD